MKKITIIIVLVIILFLFGVYTFQNSNTKIEQKSTAPSTGQAIIAPVVTIGNLDSFLKNQQFIKDIPKDSVISLRLYNFDSGERQFDGDYTVTKGNVEKKKAETYDIEILVNSKYLSGLGGDICGTMKKAKANGDFGVNTTLSKTELLWKYKSMLKYRNCLGV